MWVALESQSATGRVKWVSSEDNTLARLPPSSSWLKAILTQGSSCSSRGIWFCATVATEQCRCRDGEVIAYVGTVKKTKDEDKEHGVSTFPLNPLHRWTDEAKSRGSLKGCHWNFRKRVSIRIHRTMEPISWIKASWKQHKPKTSVPSIRGIIFNETRTADKGECESG